MSKQRKLRLGARVFGVGHYRTAWRQPEVAPDGNIDLPNHVRQVQLAEAAKFDFVFFADGVYVNEKSTPKALNSFEPLTLLSALAAVTKRIGLVGTISTSYTEPYNVARQLASLDLLSGGRAGWNVVTTGQEGASQNFGRESHYEHAVRYRRAREHLEVVQGLWSSWEEDAFVYDKERGVFFDPRKLHELNYRGEFFSVKGPLNISRSKQGEPVIFQAGGSETGKAFAAESADAVYTTPESLEEARLFYRDLKGRMAAYGREPDQLLIFPGLHPFVGRTEEEAWQKYEQVVSYISLADALQELKLFFPAIDFTQYDPDGPFPELGDEGGNRYRYMSDRIKRVAREEKLTLRQTAFRYGAPSKEFVGTGEQLADRIEAWLEGEGADGFFIWPPYPTGLDDFIEHVVPVLQRRGLYREEYEADTLRGQLGLDIPASRHFVRQ
ncbi:LLM class flavin-dependent oxidoreductase [Paenibacillus hemerocallicola]|uniref:LLM class flavin-dependent oxidoreductase n=1 Tax=Paenibacillus hemerocallicola TaxID=1172614 RepID=A0A5C4TD22_9BACL|nr:LLM class flavin-dependent oxidoreductase [Paenibacillus hemerocallicola]TNJ66974.1 LLM class flavin-dependent oxidoreductase [Paenibacillus hemerocallicola]